jgi:hypothetical protein
MLISEQHTEHKVISSYEYVSLVMGFRLIDKMQNLEFDI